MTRPKTRPMPDKFHKLGVYNSEVHRGIAHTKQMDKEMATLQAEFNTWIRGVQDEDGVIRVD